MNSANAKTCYVCVSPLPSRAAAPVAHATGRRYASFPDEVSTSAEIETDTGAQIAHDILRGMQKRSKPKRAPLPRAVAIPEAEPETSTAQQLAAAAAAIVAEEAVAPPPAKGELVSERVATEEERETFLAASVAPAPVKETELKAEIDWPPAPQIEPDPAIPEPQESTLLSSSSALEAEVESASIAEEDVAASPSTAKEEEAELVGVAASSEERNQTSAIAADPLPNAAAPAPVASTTTTEANRSTSSSRWGSVKPTVIASDDWRRELSSRVEAYRSRTESAVPEPQNGLPFAESAAEETETVAAEIPAEEPSPRASLRTAARQRTEAVEIVAIQPEFDFAVQENEDHPRAQLVPVAELGERRAAGLLDAAFVTAAYLGFLVVFSSLGGKISFGKMELALFGITFFLFYVQYFGLFTYFGGITPGMMIRGLRVVGFDGASPTSQQLLQRTFGYVVSAASLMLGFVWSLWDEDHLTWHDRMSHTYLTHAAPQDPAQ